LAFAAYQYKFFNKNRNCSCGENGTVIHYVYFCPIWAFIRENFFLKGFSNMTLLNLINNLMAREGLKLIVNNLLCAELDEIHVTSV